MKKILIALLTVVTLSLASEVNATAAGATTPRAPAAGVWQNRLDPVYKVPVDKMPKFQAEIRLKNGKKIRFASVKSMMQFFYHPEQYPLYRVGPQGKAIDTLFVTDYLSGEKIPAESAWYVFGSTLMGPHGDDLIPLSSQTRAELFSKRYHGQRIMNYKELREKGYGLIKYLDM